MMVTVDAQTHYQRRPAAYLDQALNTENACPASLRRRGQSRRASAEFRLRHHLRCLAATGNLRRQAGTPSLLGQAINGALVVSHRPDAGRPDRQASHLRAGTQRWRHRRLWRDRRGRAHPLRGRPWQRVPLPLAAARATIDGVHKDRELLPYYEYDANRRVSSAAFSLPGPLAHTSDVAGVGFGDTSKTLNFNIILDAQDPSTPSSTSTTLTTTTWTPNSTPSP